MEQRRLTHDAKPVHGSDPVAMSRARLERSTEPETTEAPAEGGGLEAWCRVLPRYCTSAMSRPCTVSAQITVMSMAIKMAAQTG